MSIITLLNISVEAGVLPLTETNEMEIL